MVLQNNTHTMSDDASKKIVPQSNPSVFSTVARSHAADEKTKAEEEQGGRGVTSPPSMASSVFGNVQMKKITGDGSRAPTKKEQERAQKTKNIPPPPSTESVFNTVRSGMQPFSGMETRDVGASSTSSGSFAGMKGVRSLGSTTTTTTTTITGTTSARGGGSGAQDRGFCADDSGVTYSDCALPDADMGCTLVLCCPGGGCSGGCSSNGCQSAVGCAGNRSCTVVEGPRGATGPQGNAGLDGARGATGPQGEQGDAGIRGPTGPAGGTTIEIAQIRTNVAQTVDKNPAATLDFETNEILDANWSKVGTGTLQWNGPDARIRLSLNLRVIGSGPIRSNAFVSVRHNGVVLAQSACGYVRDDSGHDESSYHIGSFYVEATSGNQFDVFCQNASTPANAQMLATGGTEGVPVNGRVNVFMAAAEY